MRRASSRDTSMPRSSAGRCQRSRTSGARCGRGWTSTTPGRTVPPASSAMSAAQRSSAGITIPGSAPRSKRWEASVLRPWRREVRRMLPGANQADSSSTRVVPAEISESPPPITPASALPRSRSAMRRSSGSSVRSLPSRVTIFSPGRAVRTTISRAGHLVEVEGVERMAELEQHEVGRVDHVGDGADAARLEPPREPERRGADRDALDDARRVAGALVRRLDADLHRLDGGRALLAERGPGEPDRRARGSRRPRARCPGARGRRAGSA